MLTRNSNSETYLYAPMVIPATDSQKQKDCKHTATRRTKTHRKQKSTIDEDEEEEDDDEFEEEEELKSSFSL